MSAVAPRNDAGESLEAAHRALRADPTLQFHFTDYAPPRQPQQSSDWLRHLLDALGPAMRVVFWTGVAIIVALILYALISELARRSPGTFTWPWRRKPKIAPAPTFRPTEARARTLLEEADRLAREGRYSEAVRVLLHRSIEDIEQTFKLTIGPSVTSREIARLDQLSSHGRDVFGGIARAVEISLFGERPLDEAQFAECRKAYAAFALGARA